MICRNCHGVGWVEEWPCPNCSGFGVEHCCDGLQEQPEDKGEQGREQADGSQRGV
jgi:hypothetical protein